VVLKKNGLNIKGLRAPASSLVFGGLLASFTGLQGQSLVEGEVDRRRDNVIAAEESVIAGDEAYESHDFQQAVQLYREAFSKIPEGTKTQQFREVTRERYAQAAVQAARVMNRGGDRSGAIRLVDEVLSDSVYPSYEPARKYRAKLDDPITTNPSLTSQHAQKIDEVRRLLYKAEGEYNLGKFDEALAGYESVLRIDSYNKAARRGMERVNAAISDYSAAAYDQTRAKLLSDAEAAWELNPPKDIRDISVNSSGLVIEDSGRDLNRKLDEIIVPIVSFEDASIEEAVEYLQAKSRELDPELDEGKRGVSFILNLGTDIDSPEVQEIKAKSFSLRLQNVPLREVVKYVTSQTGTTFDVDEYAVVIRPLVGSVERLIVRQYNVPPTFLTQAVGSSSEEVDIFSDEGDGRAKLAPRLTAREYLENLGVVFPEGGSATYTSSLNQLTVKALSSGHDLVAGIVDVINSQEPIAVVVETKVIRTSQDNLEELGFDIALNSLSQSGDLILGGGTVGEGIESTFTGEPLTSGLRSGNFATGGDPLDELISSGLTGSSGAAAAAAPGAFSVIGSVSDTGVGLLLRGLSQKTGVDLLTLASVVTRSGEQASVESVREFTYPTEYEPPELPNTTTVSSDNGVGFFPVTPANPTAFETRNVGVTLEVQPVVSEDRNVVSLTFAARVDEFLGFINYGTPISGGGGGAGESELTSNEILQPIFSSIQMNSTVEVANNRTLIVGGLLSEDVSKVEDKVPVLGDLPFIGRFFTSDVLRREKEVVMIFVTVRVVDPAGNNIQN